MGKNGKKNCGRAAKNRPDLGQIPIGSDEQGKSNARGLPKKRKMTLKTPWGVTSTMNNTVNETSKGKGWDKQCRGGPELDNKDCISIIIFQ